jgi:hypothetical protein
MIDLRYFKFRICDKVGGLEGTPRNSAFSYTFHYYFPFQFPFYYFIQQGLQFKLSLQFCHFRLSGDEACGTHEYALVVLWLTTYSPGV